MVQPHNRRMSISLYISVLAVSDSVTLAIGRLKFTPPQSFPPRYQDIRVYLLISVEQGLEYLLQAVFITARIPRMGKVIFSLCVSVHTSTRGGYPIQPWTGEGPRSQIFRGGPRSQIFQGGVPVSDFRGVGVPGLRFFWGGPPPSKGKNF